MTVLGLLNHTIFITGEFILLYLFCIRASIILKFLITNIGVFPTTLISNLLVAAAIKLISLHLINAS
jgi:hypothetical protein